MLPTPRSRCPKNTLPNTDASTPETLANKSLALRHFDRRINSLSSSEGGYDTYK